MKIFKNLAKVTLISVGIFLSSCSKDDSNPAAPQVNVPNNPSYITAKVAGTDFSSIIFGTSTATCNRIGTGDQQFITILAGDLSANSIAIQLWNVSAVGVINLDSAAESFLNYTPGTAGIAYATSADCAAATGSITVTYIDNVKVEGTFSFTGVDTDNCGGGTKIVTDGSFRGTFQN